MFLFNSHLVQISDIFKLAAQKLKWMHLELKGQASESSSLVFIVI